MSGFPAIDYRMKSLKSMGNLLLLSKHLFKIKSEENIDDFDQSDQYHLA